MSVHLKTSDFRLFFGDYKEQSKMGFRPRKDLPPVKISPPVDWGMDPFQDRNWTFQLSAWRMLPPVWRHYYRRSWALLQREVMPWVRDWHHFHFVEEKRSDFMWQDMATGIRAENLALIEKLRQDGLFKLSAEDSALVDVLIAMHAEKLMMPDFISSGNHAIFQLKGLRLLGILRPEMPELQGEEVFSSEMMGRLIDSQFTEQGVHVENSPDYHNFALVNFRSIRPELFPRLGSLLRDVLAKAEDVAPWLTLPDGSSVPVGDTEKYGPELKAPEQAPSFKVNGTSVLVKDLVKSGYAVARSAPDSPLHEQLMFVVNGQAYNTVHAHADQLGFNLFWCGTPIFVDSGKFSYNSDQWRRYFISDRAHNVVGLQGRPFFPTDTRLAGSCLTRIESSEELGVVVGGRVRRGDHFVHEREYRFAPDGIVYIQDSIECEPSDRPVLYFHLAPGAEASIRDDGVAIKMHGIELASITVTNRAFNPRVIVGAKSPEIQGWVSPAYRERVPATVIEFLADAPVRHWMCVIRLEKPSRPHVFSRLPEVFERKVKLPFDYIRTSQRRVLDDSGRAEDRFVVEVIDYPIEKVPAVLGKALRASGFSFEREAVLPGIIRKNYTHADGRSLRVAVRSAEAVPTKMAAASGSIYFAIVSADN